MFEREKRWRGCCGGRRGAAWLDLGGRSVKNGGGRRRHGGRKRKNTE